MSINIVLSLKEALSEAHPSQEVPCISDRISCTCHAISSLISELGQEGALPALPCESQLAMSGSLPSLTPALANFRIS